MRSRLCMCSLVIRFASSLVTLRIYKTNSAEREREREDKSNVSFIYLQSLFFTFAFCVLRERERTNERNEIKDRENDAKEIKGAREGSKMCRIKVKRETQGGRPFER